MVNYCILLLDIKYICPYWRVWKTTETHKIVKKCTVMPQSIYPGLITYTTLTLNIYLTITLYKTRNPFVCTIMFSLSESSKITLFKDFILEINELKKYVKNLKAYL